MDAKMVHLGESIVIKGHVTAGEDLTIAGKVEGTIDLNSGDGRVIATHLEGQLKVHTGDGTIRIDRAAVLIEALNACRRRLTNPNRLDGKRHGDGRQHASWGRWRRVWGVTAR